MVKTSVGVLAIQGAVSEHVSAMRQSFTENNVSGDVCIVRKPQNIKEIDALIIPGGETTTISKIIDISKFVKPLQKRINENNLYIMGTCAGAVLLSKKLTTPKKDIKLLNVMDMQVERNAFGRQRESFEQVIDVKGFLKPYNAVFIRAPVITKTWGKCIPIAFFNKKIVGARQDKFLAVSFHPELTDDLRVHSYFLNMMF